MITKITPPNNLGSPPNNHLNVCIIHAKRSGSAGSEWWRSDIRI